MIFKSLKAKQKDVPVYSKELGHTLRKLPPLSGHAAANEMWISLPARDIPQLADNYVRAMETEESEDWCRCQWIIHPDDTEVKKGCCRECGVLKAKHESATPPHPFKGIRKRRGDESSDCPVHTRAGLIIYFMEWVFKNGN